MGRRKREEAEIDLTPMIDVVFQLIIFFIVTLTIDKKKNEDIKLSMARQGPEIKSKDRAESSLIIELDKRGWITAHGGALTAEALRRTIRSRMNKTGPFPILIRADKRCKHLHVKSLMDICTEVGLYKINFMAIKKRKEESS